MVTSTTSVSRWQRSQFQRLFEEGGVFAYPTESVFGLGCDPLNPDAMARILEIKQRPVEKGMILVAASLEQLMPWIVLPKGAARRRITTVRAHPTTWLVPAAPDTPHWITGDHTQIAVRITTFAPVVALCESVDSPIVSTSANRAGHPALRTGIQVRKALGDQLDTIVPGGTGGGVRPSEIVDLKSGAILRKG